MTNINYKNEFAKTANEHMYIGMFNETTMENEGGPLIIDSSEGIYLNSYENTKYIDGISGMYFRNVGHGREEIAKAIEKDNPKMPIDKKMTIATATAKSVA